jgi:predicted RNA binding protein YcfA (HicA-like mRNA interferase family)
MKVRDAIKTIEQDGWALVKQVGSHRQYKHPVKTGRVTVPGKLSDDLHPKTWASTIEQAQLGG